jgi:DNA-binding SARP family transcriptional activator
MGDAPSSSAQDIFIQLLGRFEVRLGDCAVIDDRWPRGKARALLKLLAVHPRRSMHREQVLDALWPELDVPTASNQLYKNIHYIRTQAASAPALVVSAGSAVSLAAQVNCDTDLFRAAAVAARAGGISPLLYEEALLLCPGDLLPGDLYEPWTESLRESCKRCASSCCSS